ncbi:MAG: threonylcarbamoyl-AMP synthase [Actinobacteria bacterium]|nr:threonylcarbamoyl-AMP synthase [Actinomycetota bacterium]
MSHFLSQCSVETLSAAADKLKHGFLVAFPTETVYGLGADATNADAVKRIYVAKGRPADHPLIVHLSNMEDMALWSREIPTYAIALARDYWPGPMSLVLLRSELAQDFITGGQDTVAVRVPDHPLALGLLREFRKIGGTGLAAPSANRFGHVSPTTASAVEEEIGDYLTADDQILDGGSALVGIESTIIDCTGSHPRILRSGAITKEMIEESTGLEVVETGSSEIRVSGSMVNHYSPRAKIILDAMAESGEGFIALAAIPTPRGAIRLAAPKTTEEYARVLYAALRLADEKGLTRIAVMQPEGNGLEIAIRDRLTRAAAGRE